MNNLSIILKQLRAQKGIYQKELAAYLKVSIGTVSNYEQGTHEPDLDTLIKFAEYYDVSVDYLLGRTACPIFADMDKLMITDDYSAGHLLRLLPGLTPEDRACLVHVLRLMHNHSVADRRLS